MIIRRLRQLILNDLQMWNIPKGKYAWVAAGSQARMCDRILDGFHGHVWDATRRSLRTENALYVYEGHNTIEIHHNDDYRLYVIGGGTRCIFGEQ